MSLNSTSSLFLLSHKDNPIQWRTWGPDALAEAKASDKPILLSMGYVGCHWCQVMNREAFSDPDRWSRMAVLNIAKMGKFSSDRTIRQYAEEIWNASPVKQA